MEARKQIEEQYQTHKKLRELSRELLVALKGMMEAYAPGAEATVAREGVNALQSDVKRARMAIINAKGMLII